MARNNKSQRNSHNVGTTKADVPLSIFIMHMGSCVMAAYLVFVLLQRIVPPYDPNSSVSDVFDAVVTNAVKMVVGFVDRHPEIGESFKSIFVWMYKIIIQASMDCVCHTHSNFQDNHVNITWAEQGCA